MNIITLLTATYNHPAHLLRLYQSLLRQTRHDFVWLVVNDGSEAETDQILQTIQTEKRINVTVISQKNSGKGKALNNGLNHLPKDTGFVLIVDDDEELVPNAVEIIYRYYTQYKNTDCGALHFNRKDENGNIIAKNFRNQDLFMSLQQFKANGYMSDGYIGYFTDKLADTRFSAYPGEKYIPPSTLIMKVTRNTRLLWSKEILGSTSYLSGGITKQGRKLRLKNPQGMIEYCRLLQHKDSGLKNRFLYSIQAFAYMEFVKPKIRKQISISPFMTLAKFPGKLLAIYWKRKFLC